MKDASCFLGRGWENVGVNVYASDQTSQAVEPVIAYTIFISACLKMCFEDTWLEQYFYLLVKICFLLFRCQIGGIS